MIRDALPILLGLVVPLGLAAGCASADTARTDTPRSQSIVVPVAIPDLEDHLPPVALAPGITPEDLGARVQQFAPVEIDFADSLLDAEQRIVVQKLVEASEILHEIFLEQVWRSNPAYREELGVLGPAIFGEVGRKPFFTSLVMHELAHGLGPREVHGTETPVSVALQSAYSAIEEAKADVIGVHSLGVLADQDVYAPEFKRQVYASAVASLFRCVRFGTGEAHGKGCAVQFHALLDGGAIRAGGDGRFTIDFDRIGAAYANLGRALLTLEATGDRAGAETLLAEKGTLPAAIEAALERLADVPVDIRPRYTVVEKITTWL